MLPRHEKPTRLVDERHDCQDIGPAYVPGTVWGTASSQTAKFRSRRRACRLIPANYYAPLGSAVSPARSAGQQHRQRKGELQLSIASSVDAPLPARGQRWQNPPGRHLAPDRGGFWPPSTGCWQDRCPDARRRARRGSDGPPRHRSDQASARDDHAGRAMFALSRRTSGRRAGTGLAPGAGGRNADSDPRRAQSGRVDSMPPSPADKAPGIRSGSAPPALRCHLADQPIDRDAAHGETVGDHANPQRLILALPSTQQRERWLGSP